MLRISSCNRSAWGKLAPTYERSSFGNVRTLKTSSGPYKAPGTAPKKRFEDHTDPTIITTTVKYRDPGFRRHGRPVENHHHRPMPPPASKNSRKRTPSQIFMEDRNEALVYARKLSERNAKKTQQEKIKSQKSDADPIYTYQPPKPVTGDVVELFGPESIQNREVLPGDFVEIRSQGKTVFGIYLQSFDQSEGRLYSTSITQGDQIFRHRTADVVFRIPGYIFMDKARTKVGDWDVEANPTTFPIGTGKIAASFADEARVVMGTYYTKFNTVYDTFWCERKQKSITTPEIAKYVFGKESPDAAPLTLLEIYATHLYLTEDASLLKYVPSVAIRWTGEFAMQQPQEVLLTETVIEWMRTGDARVAQFMEKAKVLVDGYRQGDKSAWKEIAFSDSDRMIIEFVRQTAFTGYSDVFPSPRLTYLPKLLRSLGSYGDIEPRTAFTFLNEIGIWPTWYNMEINRSAISLTDSIENEQAILNRIRTLSPDSLQQDFEKDIERIKQDTVAGNTTVKPATPSASSPLILQSPTELYKRDPCDSIRHDFGEQAIFAIDDPSASELDDAFAVEPVPITTLTPKPSTWIHVHVADPTSILPPLHEMSRLAAERVLTVYLPEGTWPMLPRLLTEETLSLKNDGKPKKVMTFSARLSDETGDILEYKVRPGIVRKLVTLNYDDVDDHLQWDRVHGGKAEGDRVRNSQMRMPEEMSKREYYRATSGTVASDDKGLIKELLGLQDVAKRHMDFRLKNGAFNFNLGRTTIEISPFPLQPVAEVGWEAPVDYTTWQEPQISCRLDRGFASPSRMMVAEYMIIAGRVAAMFAQEHDLPTLYRNQSKPAEKYRTMFEERVREMTNPLTGMMGLTEMLPLRPYIPGAEISTTSVGHWSMGLHGGYCKVTSPLRRYSDMVCHWQIKGALLSKHESSSSSVTATPPLFSLDTLTPLAGLIRDRERTLGMLEARSVKFWLYEMFRRRLESGLSNVFDGIVMNPTEDGYNVISTLLGFQTVVKAEPKDIQELQIGTKVSFEVNACNPQRPWVGAKHIAKL
ncbi:hypothetical protein EDD21DRAFT_439835 [Dissophora ornata]|nr:hypothetical protein BGZ58_005299 [Dissophora ornata]KAI8606060.1 hypothetical protein EDD21DRAFT_439835 [Dissophora ornata]